MTEQEIRESLKKDYPDKFGDYKITNLGTEVDEIYDILLTLDTYYDII